MVVKIPRGSSSNELLPKYLPTDNKQLLGEVERDNYHELIIKTEVCVIWRITLTKNTRRESSNRGKLSEAV